MTEHRTVPVAPTDIEWLIDRLHERAVGRGDLPSTGALLEAAAIELTSRAAAPQSPDELTNLEPREEAKRIIETKGEHYAALLMAALDEQL